MAKSRPRWTYPAAAFLGALLLRALRTSWRVDERPRGLVLARAAARPLRGPGTVYLQWHSRILLGAATQAHRGLCVLVSQHGDGEYIARTVERLGFRTVRGSSTRGGARALLGLLDLLRDGHDVAITPDGPRGPRLRVQAGCVAAASASGAAIVPVGLDCRRSRRLRSWDRFLVPWPFTRVAVRFGAPIEVPPDLDEEETERWRVRVEEALRAVQAEATAACGAPPEPE